MSFALSALGVERVAELVAFKARQKPTCLWLSPHYEVTIESIAKSWRNTPEPPGEWMVGVYTTRVQPKDVIGDIRARIDELKATAQLPLPLEGL